MPELSAGNLDTHQLVSITSKTILNACYPCTDNLTTGAIAYTNAYFGRGSGGIFLSNVGCTGTESSLLSCTNPGIGYHTCDHSNDAGIRCLGRAATVLC